MAPIVVTSLPDAKPRPRDVAIGTFDGVHKGHQAVIEGADTVLTFDPHPLEILHPAALPKLIMPFKVKRDVIEGLGVEELVIIPFDEEFAKVTAEGFVDQVLVETLDDAYCSALRRTAIGPFRVEDAGEELSVERVAELVPAVEAALR